LKKGKRKPAPIKDKVLRLSIDLGNALTSLVDREEDKDRILKEFSRLKDGLERAYFSIVNPSVIARDQKWISYYYWFEVERRPRYIEIFKGKRPIKEGLEDYRGYVVLEEGGYVTASSVCEWMGLDYGQGAATRYLWNYLNKVADKWGVENPGMTYDDWMGT